MIEILLGVGCLALSFWAGYWFREYRAKIIVKRYQKLLEEVAKQAETATIEIEIQRAGEMFFVYDKKTNEFLAQGKDHKEISEVLAKRFPGKMFTADRQNLKDIDYHYDSV